MKLGGLSVGHEKSLKILRLMAESLGLAGLYHYLKIKQGMGKKINVAYHLREKSGWDEDLGSNCSIF